MEKSFRFGVLSTARIGVEKVIPEMMQSDEIQVAAIASRDIVKAELVAKKLGLLKAYGSYEELLADDQIDAIYNPLPNHLHVPWSILAAKAGKHVLCEKPIAPKRLEAIPLLEVARQQNVLIQEAFMVLTHPQWKAVHALIHDGKIGELRAIQGTFAYFNDDPANIRNRADIGGGGLLDIGCYPIVISRFLTGREPNKVSAILNYDPNFQTDRLGAVNLEFTSDGSDFPVVASFVFSTQLTPFQRMTFLGTQGRLEVTLPFNPPAEIPTQIWFDDGSSAPVSLASRQDIEPCAQYRLAGEAFAQAALKQAPTPVPMEWSLANMAVIDAAFESAKSGHVVQPKTAI